MQQKNNNPIHAVILLAGTGSRLKPLTDHTHKSLINIHHKSFLERIIFQLYEAGITGFHLALGYRASEVQEFVESHLKHLGSFYFYENQDYQTTNNAFSLLQVLKDWPEPHSFLLIDGDLLLGPGLIQKLLSLKNQSALLCDTNQSRLDDEAMKLTADQNQNVIALSKNIPVREAVGEAIGVTLLQKDWANALIHHLATLLKDSKCLNWYYEDVIQDLIQKQQSPSPLKYVSTQNEPWVEVDHQDDLERAKSLFP